MAPQPAPLPPPRPPDRHPPHAGCTGGGGADSPASVGAHDARVCGAAQQHERRASSAACSTSATRSAPPVQQQGGAPQRRPHGPAGGRRSVAAASSAAGALTLGGQFPPDGHAGPAPTPPPAPQATPPQAGAAQGPGPGTSLPPADVPAVRSPPRGWRMPSTAPVTWTFMMSYIVIMLVVPIVALLTKAAAVPPATFLARALEPVSLHAYYVSFTMALVAAAVGGRLEGAFGGPSQPFLPAIAVRRPWRGGTTPAPRGP
jgi:hypothetical protein